MLKYSIRRLAYSAVILFFVMFIIYSLMYAMPQEYVERKATELSSRYSREMKMDISSNQLVTELNDQYGIINKGLIGGYLTWLGSAVRFDFGTSWAFAKSCTQVFHEKIWYTFRLNIITMFFVILIAIPLGVQAARNQYGAADYSASVFSMISISLPSFFVIILLKYIFSVKLGVLPLTGIKDARELTGLAAFFDSVKHMVLPVMALTLAQIGSIMRYTRTNMLEVLSSDYIRTARAKGVPERNVIYTHAFRNTMIPLITILSTSLVGLFYGSIVTEELFALEGIGKASYDAIEYGDIPFTMFYLMFIALLTLIGNLIADLLYAAADPRVRLS